MPSLRGIVDTFTTILTTEGGLPFAGKILPAGEGDIPNFLFSFPRLLLRVAPDCPVSATDIVEDDFGRFHLVADYAAGALAGEMIYRTHQLFQVDREVTWTRQVTTTDALTGLAKTSGTPTTLGPIRITTEIAGREYPDRQSNAKEESIRIITGAEIQLNDKVDGMVVKKVFTAFGVYVGEVQ